MLDMSDLLILGVVSPALLAIALAFQAQHKHLSRLRYLLNQEKDERVKLQQMVEALLSCSKNIGERVRDQDVRQNSLLKKLDVIDLYRTDGDQSAYEQVRRFSSQGIDPEEIANLCNLTRGEVDLLNHMAAHKSAA